MDSKIKSRCKLISAVHLVLRKHTKILLLRRYNTGYEDGNYSMIAGHLDGDEPAKEAMIREGKEEAGIDLRKGDLKMVHVMHRGDLDHINGERIDFFFEAQKWKGTPKICEKHLCDDMKWFELNKLPDNMVPYINKAISEIIKKSYYCEFNW